MADPAPHSIAVRVISLPGSAARRAAMTAQLAAIPGLDWAFFDAGGPPPPGLSHAAARARRRLRRDLTPGELGCYASHFALWTWLAAAPCEALVVLEDDVIVDPAFFARLAELPAVAYLRLYAKVAAAPRQLRPAAGRHLIRFRGQPYGTQAYVIRRHAAAVFTARLAVIERPVDDAMDRFWSHGIPPLALFPFPVLETAGPSTIEAARRAPASGGWLVWKAHRALDSLRRRAANLRLALTEIP